MLNLLGSLDILGSPISLLSTITDSATELVTKPAEGFIEGPLEGGLGLMYIFLYSIIIYNNIVSFFL